MIIYFRPVAEGVWWVRWNPSPVSWNQKELHKNNPKRQNWMQFWRWKCRKSFAALLWTLTRELTRVPAGQGKLEKVREFEWSGKRQGKWKIGATMSDFQAEMHQIRFSLSPDPAGGAYSTPPDPLAALNIAPWMACFIVYSVPFLTFAIGLLFL